MKTGVWMTPWARVRRAAAGGAVGLEEFKFAFNFSRSMASP
jgi:hypothetical protein